MLKKIALGALMTGLVAVLVVGAVNRTNAVSGDASGETGRRGQAAYTETEPLAQGNGGRWSTTEQATTGRGGQGAGYVETEPLAQGNGGRWSTTEQEATGRGGRWAQESAAGQAQGGGANVPQAEVLPSEWKALQGTVVSATDDLVEIQAADGAVLPFEGQPLRFALSQGFSAQVGDEVSLSGFDEDGEFKIGSVTNLSNGATFTLRDTSGRPGWSGGRRG